ncbi:MAG: type II toxin-antitoxin system RelE/ParE family toxin [Cyclobacteriaceae bacterium]|nr:type II toxin-antitoxin system RelE/ParE family toxin [Cyclobacteriaceae bacterium]
MILDFSCKHTEKVWNGVRTTKWDSKIQKIALRKLFMINAAHKLFDLKVPPGNNLHPLKDDLNGYQGIKINDQWRIIFIWSGNDAESVKITDYH